MRLRLGAAITVTAALLLAAPAGAFIFQPLGGPLSGTNGIVRAADGTFWVAEEFADPASVVHMSQSGAVIHRYIVDPSFRTLGATAVTIGPGGRVWITVPDAHKLVWINATSPVPSAQDVHSVLVDPTCRPTAIAAGGGVIYFSLVCQTGASKLGMIRDNGDGVVETADAGGGSAYDLEVAGGYLFAPGRETSNVRRIPLGTLNVESSVMLAPSGGPEGVTADGAGNIWVTENISGKVARFPVNGSTVDRFAPSGGTLTEPFGIVAGTDGNIYVAGTGSANIVRMSPDGGSSAFYSLPNSKPWNIINGADGDLWLTDRAQTRILRLLSTAPRVTTGAASATGPTSASAAASVNPRGNETQVVFDYGPTTAYGATSTPVAVPNGADPVQATGVLTGLKPSTTYHVRARATNPEGSVTGADTTFTTQVGDADGDGVSASSDCDDNNAAIHPGAEDKPGDKVDQDCSGADATYQRLASRIRYLFRRNLLRNTWRVRKLEIIDAVLGSRVELRCRGRGCFKHKAIRVRKSRKVLSLLSRDIKRARLKRGVVFEVRITKNGHVGSMKRFTVRSGSKDPKAQEYCLPVGKGRPTRC